jgi:hypothetical protein
MLVHCLTTTFRKNPHCISSSICVVESKSLESEEINSPPCTPSLWRHANFRKDSRLITTNTYYQARFIGLWSTCTNCLPSFNNSLSTLSHKPSSIKSSTNYEIYLGTTQLFALHNSKPPLRNPHILRSQFRLLIQNNQVKPVSVSPPSASLQFQQFGEFVRKHRSIYCYFQGSTPHCRLLV